MIHVLLRMFFSCRGFLVLFGLCLLLRCFCFFTCFVFVVSWEGYEGLGDFLFRFFVLF